MALSPGRRERDGRGDLPEPGEGKRGVDGHLAYLLRQASAAVRHIMDDALAPIGLTHPKFVVLTLLRAYGSLSGAEVARLAAITPQTANTITTNLLRMGAIARAPDPSHGRVVRLTLTEVGQELLTQAQGHAGAVEQRLAATLDSGREQMIREWLVRIALDVR